MRPNPSSDAGRNQPAQPVSATAHGASAAPPRQSTPPSERALAGRPFGYLLATAIWLALFCACLLLPALLPIGLRAENADWTTAGFFADSDVAVMVLFLVFSAIVLAPLLGTVFLALLLATGSLAVLAATYVVRSIRPSYRGERLSATGWSREALGPITLFPVAMSLIPQRQTDWTRFWTLTALLGWSPGLRMLRVGAVFGIGYFLTIGWALWPVHSAALLVVWWIITLAFAAGTIVLLVREGRRRYTSASAAPASSTVTG
ncbi:hypothetical protein ACX9R5_06570 [Rathayibacter sp. CAU 1779]